MPRFPWALALVRSMPASVLLPSVRMAITGIIRTRAHPMATTARTGLQAACSSVPALGIAAATMDTATTVAPDMVIGPDMATGRAMDMAGRATATATAQSIAATIAALRHEVTSAAGTTVVMRVAAIMATQPAPTMAVAVSTVAAEDSTAVEAAALTAVAAAMAAVGTASSAVFQPEARSDQLRASFFAWDWPDHPP